MASNNAINDNPAANIGPTTEAMAVAAAAANDLAKRKRGPNFTVNEDVLICMAFVAASEDAAVGTNQKSADFKKRVHELYIALVTDSNNKAKTTYNFRTALSVFNRFKRLSKLVLKFIAVEEMSQKPSGDNGEELYAQLCRKTFIDRYPSEVNMVEHIVSAAEFLRDKPKWRLWQTSEDSREQEHKQQMKARPTGNKKAKQMEHDLKLVEKLIGSDEKKEEVKQSAKDKLLKEVGLSMSKVGGTMDVIVASKLIFYMRSLLTGVHF